MATLETTFKLKEMQSYHKDAPKGLPTAEVCALIFVLLDSKIVVFNTNNII